jgi:endonuclease/exonuclease/phosphatase family metal-dependent hydrolase
MNRSILLATLFALGAATGCASDRPAERFRVMTFNLWHGGEAGGEALKASAAAIREARADIVGLQETEGLERDGARRDNAKEIGKGAGLDVTLQGGRRAIASRFPIDAAATSWNGTVVTLPSGRRLVVFNVHLAAAPYQPYQLLSIPYFDAPKLETASEAVAAARSARGEAVDEIVTAVRAALGAGEAVVVTGDFNEPSWRDWSEAAARAGLVPLAVEWPASRALEKAGLADGYRAAHPDPIARRGLTWTPTTREDDPQDRHDRIDFVFAGGVGLRVVAAEVVGERNDRADIVVAPWPSDHRAVVVTLEWDR